MGLFGNNKVGVVTATFLVAGFAVVPAIAADNYKFDFGDGPVAAGYTQVKSNTKFSESLGYGFESGSVSSVDRLWDDDLKTDFLTAKGEMIFSVVLPQGNYEVTFIFGDGENESETTVWAENRKLIFDRVTTAGGVFSSQTVSLRRMEKKSVDGSVTMSLKDRENGYRTWDNKLTFTITGKSPAVAGIEIKRNDNVTTLWLCGNSTVVDQLTAPWSGWGQMASGFFKPSLAVANYAESGLTASGFYSMRRLNKILAEAKKGDYVTVQFAHNDQKNANDVANYETTLTKYVNDIKAKGAIPLFVTSTARQGELDPKTSVGGLPERMRALAKKLGVTYLDLNQHSINLQNALGGNKEKMYMYTAKDKTHFCEYGAYELARSIAEEIKAKVPALAAHLRDDHVAFDSKKPDALNVLTVAKAPITEGGLIQVEESSSSAAESSSSEWGEVTQSSSSDEMLLSSSSVELADTTVESSSSAAADSVGGTAIKNVARAFSGWHVEKNGGAFTLNAATEAVTARVFDMNGRLVAARNVAAGMSWTIPANNAVLLLQVKCGNRVNMVRLK